MCEQGWVRAPNACEPLARPPPTPAFVFPRGPLLKPAFQDVEDRLQGALVESPRSTQIHPPTIGLIFQASSSRVWVVRRCSFHALIVARILLTAFALIAGLKLVKMVPIGSLPSGLGIRSPESQTTSVGISSACCCPGNRRFSSCPGATSARTPRGGPSRLLSGFPLRALFDNDTLRRRRIARTGSREIAASSTCRRHNADTDWHKSVTQHPPCGVPLSRSCKLPSGIATGAFSHRFV